MKVLNKIKSKMCLNKPPVTKGFRVSLKWDLGVKKGICCGSLQELRQKISLKFPECGDRELGLYTHDGTEVWGHLPGYCTCVSFSLHDPLPSLQVDDSEFLLSLPAQSLLLLAPPPELGDANSPRSCVKWGIVRENERFITLGNPHNVKCKQDPRPPGIPTMCLTSC